MKAIERFDRALIQALWPSVVFSSVWMLCAKMPLNLLVMLNFVLLTGLVDKRFDLWLHPQ